MCWCVFKLTHFARSCAKAPHIIYVFEHTHTHTHTQVPSHTWLPTVAYQVMALDCRGNATTPSRIAGQKHCAHKRTTQCRPSSDCGGNVVAQGAAAAQIGKASVQRKH